MTTKKNKEIQQQPSKETRRRKNNLERAAEAEYLQKIKTLMLVVLCFVCVVFQFRVIHAAACFIPPISSSGKQSINSRTMVTTRILSLCSSSLFCFDCCFVLFPYSLKRRRVSYNTKL